MVSWLPANADEGDPDLWHVVHPDGDEEDLEESELLEGIVKLQESGLDENANEDAFMAAESSDLEISDKKDEVVVSSTSASARLSLEIVKEEPKIVRTGASIIKVIGSSRDRDRDSSRVQAGISGFRMEFLRIYDLMNDPLKKFGNAGNGTLAGWA